MCRASLSLTQRSWWEDCDSLPLFHLLCLSSHSHPVHGLSRRLNLAAHLPAKYFNNSQKKKSRRTVKEWRESSTFYIPHRGDTLENKSSSRSQHLKSWIWGEKRRNVTTYQREWWHTAPSVVAPGPTSRPLSASTASQGVGCIHSPLLSLSPLPRLLRSPVLPPQSFLLSSFSPTKFPSLLCCFFFF